MKTIRAILYTLSDPILIPAYGVLVAFFFYCAAR